MNNCNFIKSLQTTHFSTINCNSLKSPKTSISKLYSDSSNDSDIDSDREFDREFENFEVPTVNEDIKDDDGVCDWLRANFLPAKRTSVQRSTIYAFYLDYCNQRRSNPINQASFGKLIRNVFIGIKTRRLGTRGNSKYHYYGVGLSCSSIYHKRIKNTNFKDVIEKSCKEKNKYKNREAGNLPNFEDFDYEFSSLIHSLADDEEMCKQDILEFTSFYKEINNQIYTAAINWNAEMIMTILEELPKQWGHKSLKPIKEILQSSKVAYYVERCDLFLYWQIIQVMVPDVLKSFTDEASAFLDWFESAIKDIAILEHYGPVEKTKLDCIKAMSCLIHQMKEINRLKYTVQDILSRRDRIASTLRTLRSLDVNLIIQNLTWICRCDKRLLLRLYHELIHTLSPPCRLEYLATWINKTLTRFLQPFTESSQKYSKAAKALVMKMNSYNAEIVKEVMICGDSESMREVAFILAFISEYASYLLIHKMAGQLQQYPTEAIMRIFLEGDFDNCDESVKSDILKKIQLYKTITPQSNKKSSLQYEIHTQNNQIGSSMPCQDETAFHLISLEPNEEFANWDMEASLCKKVTSE